MFCFATGAHANSLEQRRTALKKSSFMSIKNVGMSSPVHPNRKEQVMINNLKISWRSPHLYPVKVSDYAILMQNTDGLGCKYFLSWWFQIVRGWFTNSCNILDHPQYEVRSLNLKSMADSLKWLKCAINANRTHAHLLEYFWYTVTTWWKNIMSLFPHFMTIGPKNKMI